MKLVFYSGGETSKNRALHDALARLSGGGRRMSFSYFPADGGGVGRHYQQAMKAYRPFGFSNFNCVNVDSAEPRTSPSQFKKELSESLKRAMDSDAIYLSGGNTFLFLRNLRRTGVLPMLEKYVKQGGVLAGLSAGAIIMTPTIGLAGFPLDDADENEVGLRDYRAMGLVDFEFYPHFEKTRGRQGLMRALGFYSRKSKFAVFAAKDGSGIVVNRNQMTIFGSVSIFSQGDFYEMKKNV